TMVMAALIVGGFVYLTAKPDSPWKRGFSSAPLWSGPIVAHSAGLDADEQDNVDIYKTSRESVVYITSTVYQHTFFFVQQGRALGSGFIIRPDGQILTNHHVINGSSDVEVTLPDRTTYKAKILVKDPQDDLALIQIDPRKKLTFLPLGDSDRLQVGQKVLAIGQPFGLKGTLTVGVVSSLGVDMPGENRQEMEGMIQTDAAINSGNSGGPLLDSQGNVIGINTAIYTNGGEGSIGIGLAMPINRAKNMLDDYRAGRSFGRAWLGATSVFIAGDLADALKLPSNGGVLIQEIYRGSAAEAAGLHGYHDVVRVGNAQLGVGGDFITAVEGKPVTDNNTLPRAISRKRPGDILDVTIYRNGRTMDIKAKLGKAPDEPM
ncbi:MAG: S1C family serine protease, partial [Bryobacteraceae bacterium]